VRQLADWGADVLMIEGIGRDGALGSRDGSDFQNLHRGKRSLSLDLKSDEGRRILHRLVEDADLVFENFRPQVKYKLGVDYETLCRINPRLIYVSISGFGQSGPYRDRPSVDQIAQGMGGLMSVTGLPGQGPVRAGIAVSDCAAGLYGALGAMVALLDREVTGQGRWVQTSLIESLIAFSDFQAARVTVDKVTPGQSGNDHPTVAPMGLYPTSDGSVNIAVLGAEMFNRFCDVANQQALTTDPRFSSGKARAQNRAALNLAIEEIVRLRPSAFWVEALNAVGVPCGFVYRMDEVFEDPQVRHLQVTEGVEHPRRGLIDLIGQPISISGLDGSMTRCAPERGEHTRQVLEGLGFEVAVIDDLLARKIVAASPSRPTT
jgi:formyl-CoA transferase